QSMDATNHRKTLPCFDPFRPAENRRAPGRTGTNPKPSSGSSLESKTWRSTLPLLLPAVLERASKTPLRTFAGPPSSAPRRNQSFVTSPAVCQVPCSYSPPLAYLVAVTVVVPAFPVTEEVLVAPVQSQLEVVSWAVPVPSQKSGFFVLE